MQDYTASRSDNDEQPREILGSLRAVTHDLETFVSGWTQRLDRVIESSQPAAMDDKQLQKRADQLRQEKLQWEAEREVEQRAAKERVEQLTQAWLQLESEQRIVLQNKATQQGAGNTSVEASVPARNSPNANLQSIELSRSISPPDTLSSKSPSRGRNQAAQQFRRLRREIDSTRSDSGQ